MKSAILQLLVSTRIS